MKWDFVPRSFPKPDFVFMFIAVSKISMISDCFGGPFVVAIWDHLEEFLRCGNVKLRCVRFGETAWNVFCDSGLRCETAMRIAAICDARCETAKLNSMSHCRGDSEEEGGLAPGLVCLI